MPNAIWFNRPTIEQLRAPSRTLDASLGIVFTEIGDDYLKATMPVDDRTKQQIGRASCRERV